MLNILNNPIKLCKTGFNEKENTSKSCKYHPGKFMFHVNKFGCCGRLKDEDLYSIGYHVETIETKMKLLSDNK